MLCVWYTRGANCRNFALVAGSRAIYDRSLRMHLTDRCWPFDTGRSTKTLWASAPLCCECSSVRAFPTAVNKIRTVVHADVRLKNARARAKPTPHVWQGSDLLTSRCGRPLEPVGGLRTRGVQSMQDGARARGALSQQTGDDLSRITRTQVRSSGVLVYTVTSS